MHVGWTVAGVALVLVGLASVFVGVAYNDGFLLLGSVFLAGGAAAALAAARRPADKRRPPLLALAVLIGVPGLVALVNGLLLVLPALLFAGLVGVVAALLTALAAQQARLATPA